MFFHAYGVMFNSAEDIAFLIIIILIVINIKLIRNRKNSSPCDSLSVVLLNEPG